MADNSVKTRMLFEDAPVRRRSIWPAVAFAAVFGAGLWWISNHVAGGCTEVADLAKVCVVN